MEAWLPILLKLNQLLLWKIDFFQSFDPISVFKGGGELETKTPLKKGSYRNFNNPFIDFWLNLAGWSVLWKSDDRFY